MRRSFMPRTAEVAEVAIADPRRTGPVEAVHTGDAGGARGDHDDNGGEKKSERERETTEGRDRSCC